MSDIDRPKPRTDAERSRDRRKRKAAGEAILRLKVKKGETADRLVKAGFLRQWDSEDPVQIANAIGVALEKLLGVTRDAS